MTKHQQPKPFVHVVGIRSLESYGDNEVHVTVDGQPATFHMSKNKQKVILDDYPPEFSRVAVNVQQRGSLIINPSMQQDYNSRYIALPVSDARGEKPTVNQYKELSAKIAKLY